MLASDTDEEVSHDWDLAKGAKGAPSFPPLM